jgi:hypothetical protein
MEQILSMEGTNPEEPLMLDASLQNCQAINVY